MSAWTPFRRGADVVEAMDAGAGTEAEVAEAYRLLDRVNRLQAGYALTLDILDDLARGAPRLSFADVACGDGAFARRVTEWGRTRSIEVRTVGLDLNPTGLAVAARAPGLRPVRADARALPLADGAADVVHCSCFFHHLSTADARDLLADMCRAARRLVIVNDLVRSAVAAGSIWVLTRALVGNSLVRADGPVSVLKAFTPDELLSIAHAAAPPGWRWRLVRRFPYRMALAGARTP